MSLAETYRPRTFDQVIGQGRVIQGIKYALDHVKDHGAALLLTGSYGTGKSSIAECAAHYWGCTSMDVVRIEASEADIDRIRQLASDMYNLGWGASAHRVYILDEVHTITGRAADRLLSLLESLPRHVAIIATTTEVDWCPGGLFSRWTRFELGKVRSSDVAALLERVALAEGLPIPADPAWASKLVKYHGLNIRDQINQLPARLFSGSEQLTAVA